MPTPSPNPRIEPDGPATADAFAPSPVVYVREPFHWSSQTAPWILLFWLLFVVYTCSNTSSTTPPFYIAIITIVNVISVAFCFWGLLNFFYSLFCVPKYAAIEAPAPSVFVEPKGVVPKIYFVSYP